MDATVLLNLKTRKEDASAAGILLSDWGDWFKSSVYRGSVASRADLGEVFKLGKVAKCRADDGRCILGDTRFVLQE